MRSTPTPLLCAKRALSVCLVEEVRAADAVPLSSHLLLLPRSPPAGVLRNREHGPMLPSLTDFAAFSRFGSRAWGTSEPGSRPCLAPYPKQASHRLVWERSAAQREEEEALTHHLLRASTGYKNNRTPPCRSTSQPPCLIASLQ